ncbi:MAG: ABC transporter ATP-binding protein [Tistrella sp.]|jgi:branched-chain amino acid transport system ATP-binding protein|uniref:ABC transporter ATP-binding protein n=1 Tax=Tistrella mobilis TaxID=171437 RepID=A0A162KN33_9PROT|nr:MULTISPECIES: ABC transporter ATP-binding protein [Tistrella]KYO51686.1 ABC transporter ATP-binding protein [Tistrella mobilis]MAD35557.1 ABC transporter ATP-binding protein [Tistrella sp.]MBA74045.1 ABC transporter ATP-binding protein [Tistrella sp.]
MLTLDQVHAYYGKSHVLEGVSLEVRPGELVTLLGRNGAGKTTTLKSIAGMVDTKGTISFDGTSIAGRPSHDIARRGVALVQEHRGIFGMLSVEENLKISVRKGSRWSLDDVYAMFPRLKERRRNGGKALSGGEQQMLAIARALVNAPRILLLDEPTEGLAPVIVDEIVRILGRIRESGVPVLLVEQNLAVCEKLADRHYVLEQGRIVYAGSNADFRADRSVRDRYLALDA